MSDTTFETNIDGSADTEAQSIKSSDTATPEILDVFNANAGLHGRDGGPYLDEIQILEHEKRSAAREGKEPDLENPRVGSGVQSVTAAQLVNTHRPMGLETTTPTVAPIGSVPVQEVQVPEDGERIPEPGTGEENGGVDGLPNKEAL